MLFINGLSELASRFSKTITDAEFKALAKKKFNLGYREIGKSWEWNSLKRYGSIISQPQVATQATVTTNSYVVTGIVPTADYVGRQFQVTGQNNTYRIMAVDTVLNTLTLDQPMIESTGSVPVTITKRFYRVPPDVRRILTFAGDRMGLSPRNQRHLGLAFFDDSLENPFQDQPFDAFGVDYYNSYVVGSTALSSVAGSKTLTGIGTTWLSTIQPGMIVNFSGQDYRVAYVTSDTTIVLINAALNTYTGTYTVQFDTPKLVELKNPVTTQVVIPFRYIKYTYDLVNENYDYTELEGEEDQCILDFGEAYLAEAVNKPDWTTKLQKAQGRLERAQQLSKPVKSSAPRFPPLVPPGMGRSTR